MTIGTRTSVGNLTGLYSQLSGVLAGFAFAGLSFYLARSELPGQAADVAVTLFTAFVSLVMISILYALLAGESAEIAGKRVDASLLTYGMPFGLSILTSFYSLTLMAIERPELSAMQGIGRFIVVVAGPLIVMGRVNIAAMDACGKRRGWQPYHLGWILVLATPVLGGMTFVSGPLLDVWPATSASYPAYISLAATIIAAVLSPLISTRRPEFELPVPLIYVYLVVSFAVMISYADLAAKALA